MWRCAALLLLASCVTPAPVVRPVVNEPVPVAAPAGEDEKVRGVIRQFLAAVEARKFGAALALLSGDLQRRYGAARLERDFDAEPLAKERVERIRAAIDRAIKSDATRAALPLGEGRAVQLVHEREGWRISALE